MPLSSRTPPRFVPTLTEVVEPGAEQPPLAEPFAPMDMPMNVPMDMPMAAPPAPVVPLPVEPPVLTPFQQEQIVHRVMQRVDVSLEGRLREVVMLVVRDQVKLLEPRPRDEIEMVVRDSVSDAVAQELATNRFPQNEG